MLASTGLSPELQAVHSGDYADSVPTLTYIATIPPLFGDMSATVPALNALVRFLKANGNPLINHLADPVLTWRAIFSVHGYYRRKTELQLREHFHKLTFRLPLQYRCKATDALLTHLRSANVVRPDYLLPGTTESSTPVMAIGVKEYVPQGLPTLMLPSAPMINHPGFGNVSRLGKDVISFVRIIDPQSMPAMGKLLSSMQLEPVVWAAFALSSAIDSRVVHQHIVTPARDSAMESLLPHLNIGLIVTDPSTSTIFGPISKWRACSSVDPSTNLSPKALCSSPLSDYALLNSQSTTQHLAAVVHPTGSTPPLSTSLRL